MSVAGVLFWLSMISAAVVFGVGQLVSNSTLRSALFALAPVALITTGLMGAAWVTTSS